MTPSDPLPELGVGITYSSEVAPLLLQRPDLFDVVEIEPQTTWLQTRDDAQPYRIVDSVLEALANLPGRKLVHSVGAPVGGTMRPNPAQFALLRRTIERLESPWASDHLSFNSTPEFNTGFFLPPRQTWEGVNTVVSAIRDLQAALPVPLAVETGVNYLRPRPDELPDGAFVAAVVETADCGLLLDLHNIFANGLNGRQSIDDYLSQLPLERVWEMHLAGGFEMDGFYLDAHSGAIPDHLFDIAKRVVPALPNLRAIIFEVFPTFVPVAGMDTIRAQIERLHELWELRARPSRSGIQRQAFVASTDDTNSIASPASWEHALGSLVIGRSPDDVLSRELESDPGVEIVNRLIHEFRASMVVGVYRLTSRLLILALGPDIFRALLADFWSKSPPKLYASAEAAAFGEYLKALNLKVPQLAKVLEFEEAVVATLIDEQPRVVKFDIDPLPMLRALAEGHLTDVPGRPGDFEIEITPDGPATAGGLDLNDVQQAFPYH
jgi:uncharacterized protein (UPF0276 family)